MDQETITPDNVLDAAAALFTAIEDKDMRNAIAQLAAMLTLPDIDWPLDNNAAPVQIVTAAIEHKLDGWN